MYNLYLNYLLQVKSTTEIATPTDKTICTTPPIASPLTIGTIGFYKNIINNA